MYLRLIVHLCRMREKEILIFFRRYMGGNLMMIHRRDQLLIVLHKRKLYLFKKLTTHENMENMN
jgi:hypothetical protein